MEPTNSRLIVSAVPILATCQGGVPGVTYYLCISDSCRRRCFSSTAGRSLFLLVNYCENGCVPPSAYALTQPVRIMSTYRMHFFPVNVTLFSQIRARKRPSGKYS
jgi:hypothetical protein